MKSFYKKIIYGLGFVIIFFLHLLINYFLPLNDKTEARYAEIARIMAVSNDFVTPHVTFNQAFLAKPPLSMWVQASFIKLFGSDPFFIRLSSSILFLILLFVFYIENKNFGLIFLFFSIGFQIIFGSIMTEPVFVLCLFISQISLFKFINFGKNGYIFFISLGFGMLAKGPLIIVLDGLIFLLYSFFYPKDFLKIFNLPILGYFLFFLIFLPWYLLCEKVNPGFLNYFIIGENFNRFLYPAWSGDLYGHPHISYFGIIWLYFFLFCMPYSAYMIKAILEVEKSRIEIYWFCSFIAPLVFFSFAKNLIYPYAMYALPGFCLYFAHWAKRKNLFFDQFYLTGFIFQFILQFIFLYLILFYPKLVTQSEIDNIKFWPKNYNLYYEKEIPYSAAFYSKGQAKLLSENLKENFYLVSEKNTINYLNHDCKIFFKHKNNMFFCIIK